MKISCDSNCYRDRGYHRCHMVQSGSRESVTEVKERGREPFPLVAQPLGRFPCFGKLPTTQAYSGDPNKSQHAMPKARHESRWGVSGLREWSKGDQSTLQTCMSCQRTATKNQKVQDILNLPFTQTVQTQSQGSTKTVHCPTGLMAEDQGGPGSPPFSLTGAGAF